MVHGKDIRYAINTLQFFSTASEGSWGILPHFTRRARTCAEFICGRQEENTNALAVAREGDDDGLFDAMYLATTELGIDNKRRRSSADSNLSAIADALEVYSEADTYSSLHECFTEPAIADEDEIVPDGDILYNWRNKRDIATDLKAHALTTLGSEYRGALTAGDVAAETEIKHEASANTNAARVLEGYWPILGVRTAATDIVPILRTMAVGSRRARAREQHQRANNNISNKKNVMDINYAGISFSRVGMGTRSKTRGNHMHLLGVGEDACLHLEHHAMTAHDDEVLEV